MCRAFGSTFKALIAKCRSSSVQSARLMTFQTGGYKRTYSTRSRRYVGALLVINVGLIARLSTPNASPPHAQQRHTKTVRGRERQTQTQAQAQKHTRTHTHTYRDKPEEGCSDNASHAATRRQDWIVSAIFLACQKGRRPSLRKLLMRQPLPPSLAMAT